MMNVNGMCDFTARVISRRNGFMYFLIEVCGDLLGLSQELVFCKKIQHVQELKPSDFTTPQNFSNWDFVQMGNAAECYFKCLVGRRGALFNNCMCECIKVSHMVNREPTCIGEKTSG